MDERDRVMGKELIGATYDLKMGPDVLCGGFRVQNSQPVTSGDARVKGALVT